MANRGIGTIVAAWLLVGCGSGDAGPVGRGHLVACPTGAPSGACTSPGFTCQYATQTCVCTNGAWTCAGCPATQPVSGDRCPPEDLPAACVYGGLTCSCDDLGQWQCGACPAAPPTMGQSCGDTSFVCNYADQWCGCSGVQWTCMPFTCPPTPESDSAYLCQGAFSCAYPDQDQVCNCTAEASGHRACSCPAAAPAKGAACAGSAHCPYDTQVCDCFNGSWRC